MFKNKQTVMKSAMFHEGNVIKKNMSSMTKRSFLEVAYLEHA